MSANNFNTIGAGNPLNSSPAGAIFQVVPIPERNPTTADNAYNPGTEWQNSLTGQWFKLIETSFSGATWIPISSPTAGGIITVNSVGPNGSGNLTLASSGGTIAITNPSANTINLDLSGGSGAIDTILTDAGAPAVVPSGSGQVSLVGSGSIVTSGQGPGTTATVALTGLTNHAVLVGAGTSTITKLAVGNTGELLVGASAADPAFGTSANGDFTFTGSTAGAARTLTISQTDNTSGSSNAVSQITSGGASGGDAVQTFTVTGAQSWSHGIDNSASDDYVLSASTALGTTNVISATTSGILTYPLQSSFLAYLATGDSNVTGAGTAYTLGAGNALTVAQQGSGMAVTGVFTAPAAGWYQFNYNIKAQGLTAAMDTAISWVRINGANYYSGDQFITTAGASPFTTYSFRGSVVVQLAATNTVDVQLVVSNGVGDTVDILGGALTTANASFFSGIKVA